MSRIPSPDQAFGAILAGLPRPLATLIWNVTYGAAWITLPLSFLNTIADLQIVASAVQWVYREAAALRPLFDGAEPVISAVLGAWRSITEPFHAWLASVLPFDIPLHLADAIIVIAFCLPSILRAAGAQSAHEEANSRNFTARMQEQGEFQDEDWIREPAALHAGGPESKWVRKMRLRQARVLLVATLLLGFIALALIGLDVVFSRGA